MQLTTCAADLDHALRAIAPAVGAGSSHPILSCALLKAAAGELTITAYNLDLGISTTIPAAVATDGAVALPYRLLAGLVSRLEPDHPITIAGGTITAPTGSYDLPPQDPADFPDLPTVAGDATTLDLTAGVRACLMAASTDTAKQLLTGIHLAPTGHLEATDGHRLVRIAAELPDGLDLIIPAATAKLLEGRQVGIAAAAGHAVIDAGDGITITSRILDGTYPNVAALIPTTFEHTIELNRHRFIRALERVAIIAEAHNDVVKLTAADGQLVITAAADATSGREQMAHDGTAAGTWAFNVRYLIDGLKAMKASEAVVIHANAATTPVVIRPADDNALTYLVMPVQIRS